MGLKTEPLRATQLRTVTFTNIDPVLGRAIELDFNVQEVSITVVASSDNAKQTSFWIKGTGEADNWTLEFSNPYAIGLSRPEDTTLFSIKGVTGTQVDVHLKVLRY
jgi:hypothetical protein